MNECLGGERSSYVTLGEINRTSKTLPFENDEARMLLKHIKKNQSKGLSTIVHPAMEGETKEWLSGGFVGVLLPELDVSILYVKQDGGRGLLGRQKIVYGSYVGSIGENLLMPGVTFKYWGVAITGMNNLYRGEGLL